MGLKLFRTGSSESGLYIKALLAGDPGAGKTRTASTWEDPLYLSAEGGLLSVRDRDVPAFKIATSDELLQALNLLKLPPELRNQKLGVPVKTVIIDTLDEIQRILVKERLADKRQETMQQADWGWLGDQLRGIVRSFRNLDMHLVATVHVKTSEDGETGHVSNKPMIQGSMGDELAGYFDLVGLLTARPMTKVVDGEATRVLARVLQTYPDSHTTWLKDRSGRLPMELEINFEDDFERIFGLIFGAYDREVLAEAEAVVREIETEPTKPPAPVPSGAKKAAGAAKEAPAKKAAPASAPAAAKAAPEPQQSAVAVAERPEAGAEAEPADDEQGQLITTDTETAVPPPNVDLETGEKLDEAPAEETVPAAETPNDDLICQECGGPIEAVGKEGEPGYKSANDQSELSWIRYRARLCHDDFEARKNGTRR